MGTRADFYIEIKPDELQWLGSISWDGYETTPEIENSKDEETFRKSLKEFLDSREDATFPEQGWPWPWNNSKLTDETYLFKDNQVWRKYNEYGQYEDHTTPCLFTKIETTLEYSEETGGVIEPEDKLIICVPDMSHKKNIAYGKRSGLIIISKQ